ncbi:probable ATP-dependent RNA helicase DDX46 [Haliotis cracherodii]|uniref:probable ATP-dependent RNA helicase DDX46 n=1 Tax=Haliotis cracherodii TaxID=6455 RepID=UPI0039E812FA
MPRDSRSYRRRSRSRSLSRERSRRKRSRSRTPIRSRERERLRRSRSRDRERKRSRSRSRDRDTKRDRRKRSRSKEKDRKREKKSKSRSPEKKVKSPSPSAEKVLHREGELRVKDEPLNKEEEQKRLEVEMQKRRERIEKWRAERKKKQELLPINITPPMKKWTLEDDDEDEDEVVQENDKDDENEVDPLDAFMQSVTDEVKCARDKDKTHDKSDNQKGANGNSAPAAAVSGKVTFITAVAKKKDDTSKEKGEVMESNIDAMEYSSEEEEEDLDTTMSNMARKRKELTVVDHARIYYPSYRKNFYVEVPEIAKLTQEEVDQMREDMEGIKVRGKNCPKPVRSWAQCGVSKKIMDVLKKHLYERPTPIQAQAIPAVMSGRDLIGIAKTGSGKTLAFLLPMFRHVLDQAELEDEDGPIAVVMTPTRELALQISSECKKFSRTMGLRCVCVYGGTGISEQIAELKRGCEMIVCTPGRMIDMLAANNGRVTNLRRCTYVVLDEADRMFDMGFEPQVMRIMDNIRPDRQTVMFSATFPRQMEALARRILNKPLEIQVGGRSVVCKEVEQHVIILEDDKKFLKLLELLGIYQEHGSVLVFVDKQENADELMKELMRHSYPCLSLHGGIDQYDRDSTILDFKNGNIKLLVATSVAARGLDVKQLILVINYDVPNHYEDYVHRCGRTGRAGNKGFAYTFFTPEQERYAGDIIKALDLSNSPVPADLTQMWNDYKERAKAEGRTVKSSSGFRGKGFKFDETEAQLADERRKLQKAALGLQDSDDEDAGMDIDQKIEDMFASRKRVTDVAKPIANQQTQQQQSNQQKLELAKRLAARINMQRNLGPDAQDITQQAAAAILKGDSVAAPQVASKTIAEQMAEKIHAKIGYRPQAEEEKEQESAGETFKRYEEELDINDFPQTARWKVTSKEALAQICEYSEAGITVRGTYVPNDKDLKEGERKLYLAIEATSELAISKAKKEITRLIREELVRLQNCYIPNANKNRYKVL